MGLKLYGIVFLGQNRSKLSDQPGHEAISSLPVLLALVIYLIIAFVW
jgi:hypothetical protein